MSVPLQSQPRVPEPSKSLTLLALLFVPGLYVALIGSLLAVLALGAGVVWLLFEGIREVHSGRLAVVAVCVCCGVVLGAVSVIKGIIASLWPHVPFEPAIAIDFRREIALGYLIAPLCSAMDTRMPDSVILHAEPTFFVAQGKIKTFNGTVKGRILAIGLPLLAGLTKNELRAVLAHEFAHFSGKDTVYSSMVLPVYKGATRAWDELTHHLANADSLSEAVPLYLPRAVLAIYMSIFHCINMRLSRSSELRADAIAVRTCGTQSFQMGLMRAVALMGAFSDSRSVEAAKQAYPHQPPNYHIGFRVALPQLLGIANEHCARAMAEIESSADAHPSLKRRLDSAANVPERYTDNDPALSLISDLPTYEKHLGEFYSAAMSLRF